MAVKRIRPGGPPKAKRPSNPWPHSDEPAEQIADALDRIAVTLAAIDHNLEVLVDHLKKAR